MFGKTQMVMTTPLFTYLNIGKLRSYCVINFQKHILYIANDMFFCVKEVLQCDKYMGLNVTCFYTIALRHLQKPCYISTLDHVAMRHNALVIALIQYLCVCWGGISLSYIMYNDIAYALYLYHTTCHIQVFQASLKSYIRCMHPCSYMYMKKMITKSELTIFLIFAL